MEQWRQRLKHGDHRIHYVECENPKQSMLLHKFSDEKGFRTIVQGEKAIDRFIDWLEELREWTK